MTHVALSMHTQCQPSSKMQHFFLLLIVFGGGFSQEHKQNLTFDVDHDNKIEEDGETNFTTSGQNTNQTLKNMILVGHNDVQRIARNLLRTENGSICKIREAHKTTPLDILPGDSAHLWVSWKWDWFYDVNKGRVRKIKMEI